VPSKRAACNSAWELFYRIAWPVPYGFPGVSNLTQGALVWIMRFSSSAAYAVQASVSAERPSATTGGSGKLRPDAASQWLVWTERCASGAALIALAPALAGVLLSVRVFSGKSPLVAHWRAGLDGEPFWLLKIRTMWDRRGQQGESLASRTRGWIEYLENAELPVVKKGPDPRVTSSFAAFCRRFSIDELPQLIHVVSGKMRLVGPRPLTQTEMAIYYGDAAAEVLSVPPGITGLWQVLGRNSLSYAQRRRLDRFYVRKFSLKLYWFVLRRTPWCVLRGRDVF
jgi:exopolysaccharide production protein ExoY